MQQGPGPQDQGTKGLRDQRTAGPRTTGPEPVRTRAPGEALGAEGIFFFDPCQIFVDPYIIFFDPYQFFVDAYAPDSMASQSRAKLRRFDFFLSLA